MDNILQEEITLLKSRIAWLEEQNKNIFFSVCITQFELKEFSYEQILKILDSRLAKLKDTVLYALGKRIKGGENAN